MERALEMETMLYNFPGNKLFSSRLSIIYAQRNQRKGKKEKSQIFVVKLLSTHKKARTDYVCVCVFRSEADISLCIKKVSLN